MASSQLENQFRITLLEVARLLTKESVQQLAFLCERISPAHRRELENAMDLFDQLQEHGVLNEKNVDFLISWLDVIQIKEASDILKTYRHIHLEKNTEINGNCKEHDDEFMYFCITCSTKLCPKCFFRSHRNSCEVTELDQSSQGMESRKTKLTANGILSSTKERLTKAGKLAHGLVKNVSGKKLKNSIERKREREETARQNTCFQNKMRPTQYERYPELPEIDDEYAELSRDSMSGSPDEGAVGDWYQELSQNKPSTCELSNERRFVGGVMIRENQLVHVFNERQRHGSVLIVCVDPSETRTEYWRHLVAVNDNQSPVVMSYKELKYGGISHVLFAVGKTVFILHPQRNGSVYDSVHSVATLDIDKVGEGAWITSIAAHRLHSDCDDFLISVSGSNILREYQISGRGLRKIDTEGNVSSINSIAYVQNMFAVCGSRNDVYIFTVGSRVKLSGPLQPLSDPSELFPVCVIWTGGAGWMVLFVSNGKEKPAWRVACYNESGVLIKLCVEGTSPRYKGVPVSISRWGNTGFISFADSSVKSFDY